MDLVRHIYDLTKNFPREESYGLTSQIRRACISIPTNISEGYQRNYRKEYVQFLYIAKGSASEPDTLLEIAGTLNISDQKETKKAKDLLTEIIKMLNILISKLKK